MPGDVFLLSSAGVGGREGGWCDADDGLVWLGPVWVLRVQPSPLEREEPLAWRRGKRSRLAWKKHALCNLECGRGGPGPGPIVGSERLLSMHDRTWEKRKHDRLVRGGCCEWVEGDGDVLLRNVRDWASSQRGKCIRSWPWGGFAEREIVCDYFVMCPCETVAVEIDNFPCK